MIEWKVEKRKIKDLKPHPKNPRKLSSHDAANLKMSLEKFGLIDKPIITKDGMIIRGHQRITVLKKSGVKDIECMVPDQDLSQSDIDELLIRMNRVHGDFDYDILANSFEIDDLTNWGFTADQLGISDEIGFGSDEPKKKPKKLKMCPSCGHEF